MICVREVVPLRGSGGKGSDAAVLTHCGKPL